MSYERVFYYMSIKTLVFKNMTLNEIYHGLLFTNLLDFAIFAS